MTLPVRPCLIANPCNRSNSPSESLADLARSAPVPAPGTTPGAGSPPRPPHPGHARPSTQLPSRHHLGPAAAAPARPGLRGEPDRPLGVAGLVREVSTRGCDRSGNIRQRAGGWADRWLERSSAAYACARSAASSAASMSSRRPPNRPIRARASSSRGRESTNSGGRASIHRRTVAPSLPRARVEVTLDDPGRPDGVVGGQRVPNRVVDGPCRSHQAAALRPPAQRVQRRSVPEQDRAHPSRGRPLRPERFTPRWPTGGAFVLDPHDERFHLQVHLRVMRNPGTVPSVPCDRCVRDRRHGMAGLRLTASQLTRRHQGRGAKA